MFFAGIWLVGSVAGAHEASVPVDLQLQLLDRVVRYERAWAADSGALSVLVLRRAGVAESERVSAQVMQQLGRAGRLGGRPVALSQHAYDGVAVLSAQCERDGVRLVYLAPGLGPDVERISHALAELSILTVSAVGTDVDRGAVVGFELAGARPRIAIHLGSARAAGLRFDPQFLRLTRVIE